MARVTILSAIAEVMFDAVIDVVADVVVVVFQFSLVGRKVEGSGKSTREVLSGVRSVHPLPVLVVLHNKESSTE